MSVQAFYAGEPSAAQKFGATRGGRKHRGVDISHSTRPGTPVPALLGGVVVGKQSPASWHGFGHQVTIRSVYNGVTHILSYAHGSKASPLKLGQKVSAGQTVITEGNTGATKGSCVHVEDQVGGRFRDPMPLIRAVRAGAVPASSGGKLPIGRVTVKGRKVSDVQRIVGANPDNRYGRETTDKVAAWQRAHGLTPDGIWGSRSDAASAKPAPAKPAPVAAGNPFGIAYCAGLQKIARLYGYRGKIDQRWGSGSAAGFASFLRANWGYRGNDVLGPVMWAAIARWLRSRWGYKGNDTPGPVMRAALQRAETANYKSL